MAFPAVRQHLQAVQAEPAITGGLADYARAVFTQQDLQPAWDALLARAGAADVGAMLDLSTILQLVGQRDEGLALQADALARQRWYRRVMGNGEGPRLLALTAAGDLMANTPVEFLLAGWNGVLDQFYLRPGEAPPTHPPDHDVAILAVGESGANASILEALRPVLARWPRPIINGAPDKVSALGRVPAAARLAGAPGINAPETRRLSRPALGEASAFPIIVRPVDSHAGAGLEKLETRTDVAGYLARQAADAFFVQPFVDYSRADGRFCKLRIALVEGRPFIVHMAVSDHWMVHYLNAGMTEEAAKRAEEAAMFESFDQGFARRHALAFEAMHAAFSLDYFAIDCAEDREGRLLVFEADTAMIVHDMDPPEVFPYKAPAVRKVFGAVQALVNKRASSAV